MNFARSAHKWQLLLFFLHEIVVLFCSAAEKNDNAGPFAPHSCRLKVQVSRYLAKHIA